MEIKRKDDESYLSYVIRITDYLQTRQIGYTEWGDAILGADNNYSDDNLRKATYVVSKMIPKLEEDLTDTSDMEILNLIDQQKDEIYKAKVQLQDANREKRKNLREEARFENLVELMQSHSFNIRPCRFNKCDIVRRDKIQASVLISDIHYGLEVDNVLNFYNTDVAKERLNTLLYKIIEYCNLHKVYKLHVNLGGDLLNGIIKLQHRVDAEEDIITQIIDISEILAEFIKILCENVPCVEVYGVIGNHSRVNENKKMNMPAENFERLVFKYLQLKLPGIGIHLNGVEDWISYNIGDKIVFLTHGDKDNLCNARTHAINILGKIPDIIYMGHIHHLNIKDDNGTEIVINGSVISTDDYAMGLRCNTKPYQLMQVFDGDICTYKLYL